MTIQLNPYLVMNGNAKEAIEFYEKVLNGKVIYIRKFGEMPANPNFQLPEEAKDRIAHAQMKICEDDLMISDTFPGKPFQQGNHVTLCIISDDPAETQTIFQALQEDGGKIHMPLQETFWSKSYGIIEDKFGVIFNISTK